MKDWLIKKLGGFLSDNSDRIIELETLLRFEKDKWKDKDVLTEAVKDLYNTIGENDILKEINGKWMVGKKELDEATKQMLIAEAQHITKMRFWKYIQADIKYGANRTMFLKAQNDMHFMAGKLWTWMLDAMNSRIESVAQGSAIKKDTDLS